VLSLTVRDDTSSSDLNYSPSNFGPMPTTVNMKIDKLPAPRLRPFVITKRSAYYAILVDKTADSDGTKRATWDVRPSFGAATSLDSRLTTYQGRSV
jgi:hypothetical protein